MSKSFEIDETRLRQLIREEYLKGVQEFVLRGETSKFVSAIKDHIKRHIFVNLSHSAQERNDALDALDAAMTKLESDVNNQLEGSLLQFVRQV